MAKKMENILLRQRQFFKQGTMALFTIFSFSEIAIFKINSFGNRTSCRPILSVIVTSVKQCFYVTYHAFC